MKRLAAVLLITGCASHTAQIASSANDVRAAAVSARSHLSEAQRHIDTVEEAAAAVHEHIGYVSDDESPLVTSLRYAMVISVAAAAVGITYMIKTRI
jgi:uncharacterized membrane protein